MSLNPSAKKRARQTEVRALRNRARLSAMKTAVKKVVEAAQKREFANIDSLLRNAQAVIAKTRQKGTIHKNNMARKISRLAAFVNKAKKAA